MFVDDHVIVGESHDGTLSLLQSPVVGRRQAAALLAHVPHVGLGPVPDELGCVVGNRGIVDDDDLIVRIISPAIEFRQRVSECARSRVAITTLIGGVCTMPGQLSADEAGGSSLRPGRE